MNIEINTTEKTLIIKGLIAFSELIEFIKSKGFEDYSLKSESNYSTLPYLGGRGAYIQPNNGLIGGTMYATTANAFNGTITNCNTKITS